MTPKKTIWCVVLHLIISNVKCRVKNVAKRVQSPAIGLNSYTAYFQSDFVCEPCQKTIEVKNTGESTSLRCISRKCMI